MTLVVQHFVDISMTAALQNVSSCIIYMQELVLVLTQLSGASANCFCLKSNTMYPDHGQSLCYLFCECWKQAPCYIGPNNRANTFI